MNKVKNPNSPSLTVDSSQQGFFHEKNMGELAQSIGKYVECDSECEMNDRKRGHPILEIDKSHRGSVIVEAQSSFDQNIVTDELSPDFDETTRSGGILAFALCVMDPTESIKFLVGFLNLRILRSNKSGQIILTLPKAKSMFNIVIEEASSKDQARSATIYFEVDDISGTFQGTDHDNRESSYNLGDAVVLPNFHTSYEIAFTTMVQMEKHTSAVWHEDLNISVYIHQTCDRVLDYLENPLNLTKWTGHKDIVYSKEKECWMECRQDPTGERRYHTLKIGRFQQKILISWPERDVRVQLECMEEGESYCTLLVTLPSNLPERRIAAMKHIISVELDILKAILEGNKEICIGDHQRLQIEAYSLALNGHKVDPYFMPNAAKEFGFKGTILQSGDLFETMSTDFAMTIRSAPKAVLLPTTVKDIQTIIHFANDNCIPIVARGSQVSHSAGGQAQCDGGLLIDMSCLDTVEIINSQSVKVGPGVMWDAVIRATLDRGLMPPVVNDYQYLSVGGTISVGGVGFMSHQEGLQAGHVEEMEVITGNGNLVRCSNEVNCRLFDMCRAGLGQYGIITSLTLPLIPAPQNIAIFRIFYKQSDVDVFTKDVGALVDYKKINMIHSFLKPCTSLSMAKILGNDAFCSHASSNFKSVIHEEEALENVVFFLELGLYLDDENEMNLSEVRTFLTSLGCIDGANFESIMPFYEYLTRDPPVVETNKAHGSIPHPSFAVTIGQSKVKSLLENHLKWRDKSDDAVSEILVMPLKSNLVLNRGHHVPMFPMPSETLLFFVLFLGSAVGNRSIEDIREHHRRLFQSSCSSAEGGKRYSYDTITNEVRGEIVWEGHYGSSVWNQMRLAKREYDPYHILGRGVGIWDQVGSV